MLDKKLYKENNENFLVDKISYKTSTSAKPYRIRVDKIDAFVKIHNENRYLILFDYSYCDKICHRIKYLIIKKNGITNTINRSFAKIRIDSYDSLLIGKILAFHDVIIHIKSVVNKNENEYYYNIFLEKGSYKDKSNTEHF